MTATSIYKQILDQVVTDIKALALTDIVDDNVILIKNYQDRVTAQPGLPAIIVAPITPEQMNPRAGTNLRDEIGYSVGIFMIANDDQDNLDTADLYDRNLLWRETIRRQFNNKPLSGVTEVISCQCEPRQVVDPVKFKNNKWYSVLNLRFFTRETRFG